MARFIDADLLLKDIDESVVFSVRNGKNSPELRGAKKILDQIIKHISTADVVEVVRCCDCKHRIENPDIYNTCYLTCSKKYGLQGTVDPTDFCSYGERRETDAE